MLQDRGACFCCIVLLRTERDAFSHAHPLTPEILCQNKLSSYIISFSLLNSSDLSPRNSTVAEASLPSRAPFDCSDESPMNTTKKTRKRSSNGFSINAMYIKRDPASEVQSSSASLLNDPMSDSNHFRDEIHEEDPDLRPPSPKRHKKTQAAALNISISPDKRTTIRVESRQLSPDAEETIIEVIPSRLVAPATPQVPQVAPTPSDKQAIYGSENLICPVGSAIYLAFTAGIAVSLSSAFMALKPI